MADKTPPKFPCDFDGGAVGLGIVAAMSAVAAEEEMSESYTCVISHVAGSAVRKQVYFDDGSNRVRASPGVFFHSPPPPATPVKLKPMEFLNRCYLCAKWLYGFDIFMYRGDEAFCSSECRCQQILKDEYMEKRSSGALNQFEYSVSPCSAPSLFAAGVAAA